MKVRMPTLVQSLGAIERALRRLDRPVVRLLRPGIQVDKRWSDRSGTAPPNELRQLYGWRDGSKVAEGCLLDDLHFIPGFYLLSFDDALSTYSAVCSDERWEQRWFPLFANGGGDFYAISCDQNFSDFGKIVGFVLGAAEQLVEYESLTTMMATFAECYLQGVCFLSASGCLEQDDIGHAMLARRFNPAVELWRVN